MISTLIKEGVFKTVHSGEEVFDKIQFFVRKNLGLMKPLKIEPFLGYSNRDKVILQGRVLEDKNINPVLDEDNVLDNVKTSIKRFNTSEVPDVELEIEIEGKKIIATTDSEGYFDVYLTGLDLESENILFQNYKLNVLKNPHSTGTDVSAKGEYIIPSSRAEFAVISDVDDTIIQSDVTNFFRMIRLTFFNNAKTRVPFPGVSEFYHALRNGKSGNAENPIFYLSNSPWNLYDLLRSFLDIHNIPVGPLLLRDFGIDKDRFIASNSFNSKIFRITKLLKFYPELKFVLIGDSGEKDPEIYEHISIMFPERIKTIYIRNVTPFRKRDVSKIKNRLQERNIEFTLVKDSEEAARHAIEIGLIKEQSLEKIKNQKKEDE